MFLSAKNLIWKNQFFSACVKTQIQNQLWLESRASILTSSVLRPSPTPLPDENRFSSPAKIFLFIVIPNFILEKCIVRKLFVEIHYVCAPCPTPPHNINFQFLLIFQLFGEKEKDSAVIRAKIVTNKDEQKRASADYTSCSNSHSRASAKLRGLFE